VVSNEYGCHGYNVGCGGCRDVVTSMLGVTAFSLVPAKSLSSWVHACM
jgi:hypothetical protein